MLKLPSVDVSMLGGDVAIDFFNTVDWRRDPVRRSERLTTYEHVISWMAATDLIKSREATLLASLAATDPAHAAEEYDLIIKLRENTYEALNSGLRPTALQDSLQRAQSESELKRQPDGTWSWVPNETNLQLPGNRLALEFGRLLTSGKIAWFHRCEDQNCGWVFLDTSRQNNRRWCSAADCGNRNRVRTHYNRLKSVTENQPPE